MALSTSANKAIYNGDGMATSFPFAFPVYDAAHLSVIYTDAGGNAITLPPSLYSATGIGVVAGGSVIYPLSGAPLASGETLTLLRTVPLTQTTVLSNQGGYYPEVVERRFDYVYMALQQHAEELGRVDLDPPSAQRTSSVASLEDLKGLTWRPDTVIVKAGRAAGTWQWAAGSTTTADDALVVDPTSGAAGRYKRLFSGDIYAEWFGADFTADGTRATGNVTSIQAALDAAAAAGGGVVQLSDGDCWIDGPVYVPSEVTLDGPGPERCNLLATAKTFFAVNLGDIEDGLGGYVPVFRAAARNFSVHSALIGAVIGQNTTQCVVEDMSFQSCDNGIVNRGDYTTAPVVENSNNTIRRCEFVAYDLAVHTYHCGEVHIQGPFVFASPNAGAQAIVIDTASSGVHLTSVNATGGDYGIVLQTSVALSPNPNGFDLRPTFIFADRCLADSATLGGWRILKGAQLHLIDCWGSGTSNGPGMIVGNGGTNDVTDIEIIGGSFTFNGKEAIRIVGAQADLNLRLSGSIMHGNGKLSSGIYNDIEIPAGVTGVSIAGLNAAPGTGFSYTQYTAYAIKLAAGASDYIRILPDCRLSGLTGAVNNLSTGTHNYIAHDAATGRAALGLGTTAVENTVPIAKGGTGATTARLAQAALKGVYTLASSNVAVPHTGNTSRTTLATVSVPGGAMGPNGRIVVTFIGSMTGTNPKTWNVSFGAVDYQGVAATTQLSTRNQTEIVNRNAMNSQVGNALAQVNFSTNSSAVVTSAIDTTAAVDIKIDITLTNSGESGTLESYVVQLIVP